MPAALALVAFTTVLGGCGGGGTSVDQGVDEPPVALSDDEKALWMTEWVACQRVSLVSLSSVLRVPVGDDSPQVAAEKLSRRAMRDLYPTAAERQIGADGCRNGVLWRQYHPEQE